MRERYGHPHGSVHRDGEGHAVGPLDEAGVPRLDRHVEGAHLVTPCPEGGRRGGDVDRLMPELVGGNQQDTHPGTL